MEPSGARREYGSNEGIPGQVTYGRHRSAVRAELTTAVERARRSVSKSNKKGGLAAAKPPRQLYSDLDLGSRKYTTPSQALSRNAEGVR